MKLKLIDSRITKISASRNHNFTGKLSLESNINLKSVEEFKLGSSISNSSLKVEATYNINYNDLGSIAITGILFISCDEKDIKVIISKFKEKKFNSEELVTIMNLIMQKFSIKAFDLEEELGLPIHIKLPSIQFKKI